MAVSVFLGFLSQYRRSESCQASLNPGGDLGAWPRSCPVPEPWALLSRFWGQSEGFSFKDVPRHRVVAQLLSRDLSKPINGGCELYRYTALASSRQAAGFPLLVMRSGHDASAPEKQDPAKEGSPPTLPEKPRTPELLPTSHGARKTAQPRFRLLGRCYSHESGHCPANLLWYNAPSLRTQPQREMSSAIAAVCASLGCSEQPLLTITCSVL